MTAFRVKTTAETFWGLYKRLLAGEPFVYTRIGDGELEMVLGGAATGQLPNRDLGDSTWALMQNEDPRNMIALARHANEEGMRPGLFEGWKDPRYTFGDLPREFENAIALHYVAVFRPRLLQSLWSLIEGRPKLYVGALNDPKLEKIWGSYTHVAVPELNAFDAIDEWAAVIDTLIDAHEDGSNQPLLILLATGAAKCWLARRLLHRNVQVIDLGSLVDYLLGVPSRTWIRLDQEGKV